MSTVTSSVKDFLDVVRKSGLIDAKRIDEFETDHLTDIDHDDSMTVAAKMVRLQLLTSFQAKNLLSGKYKGYMLGSYRVLEPIGSGGMSVVFLAEHIELKRRVALKILPANMAKDKVTLERFYREARAAAQLDHPNIVRIHDIVQGGGLHFIVMEYVEGITLHDLLLKIGPLNHHQAAGYIANAAAGLSHAHQKGFMHRDIKPSNLILDKQGIVKILDMGLAKSFENQNDTVTRQIDENAIVGTVDIISPEQAVNDPIDFRSDIYSLGATMFMLMSGKAPFDGTTAQKLIQHQIKDAPSLTSIRSSIPSALSKVVIKMMAKKPEDRYQSAAEVIEALSPWINEQSTALDIDSVLPHHADAPTTTIRSVLSKTIKHLPKRKTNASAVESETNWKLWGSITFGLSVLTVILGCWAFGLFDSDTNKTLGPVASANTPDGSNNQSNVEPPKKKAPNVEPKKTNPPVVKDKPPLPAPSDVALLDMQFMKLTSAQAIGVGTTQSTILPTANPGAWKMQVWKKDSAGEWGVDDFGGTMALWFRSPKGDSGTEFATAKPVFVPGVNSRGRLKVTYRTEGEFQATISVRVGSSFDDETHVLQLAACSDRFRTAIFELRNERDLPLSLVFKNGNKLAQKLYISRIEIEPLSTAYPLMKFDLANAENFVEQLEPKPDMSRPMLAKYLSGWNINSWRDGQMEIESLQLDGARCLSMRTVNGQPTLQMVNTDPPRTKAGRHYTALLEYRAEANSKATIQLRRGNMYPDRVAEQTLSATEVWRTVGITYDATDEHPLYVFVQNSSPNGERLFVRSLRITEEVADPKAVGKVMQPIDISNVYNANGTEMIFSANVKTHMEFTDPGVRRIDGIPFRIPQTGKDLNNVVVMFSRQGSVPPNIPKTIEVPMNVSAKKIHMLGGVSGWGYPYTQAANSPNSNRGVNKGVVSVVIRIVYVDGKTEDIPWQNGVDLFDYNKKKTEDTGPKVVMELGPINQPGQTRQLRHAIIAPKRAEKIQRLELIKGEDDEYTAPIFLAFTVER